MSGDLRAEVGALPADVTELVFLPDCSALVAGVKGGQLLVLGMPRSLRAEAKRVLFGREEGMNGMTLQVVLLRSANLHTYLIPSDEPLLVLHYSFIF
jgi:hypothetical protein